MKHHLKTAIEVFQEVVSYESKQSKEFRTEVRVRKYMRVQAKTIVLNKQLIATNLDDEFLYKHFHSNLGYARINLIAKTCTCHKFMDKGVCKHLIAACMQQEISLPGLVQLPAKFKIIRRKKNREYRDDSRDQEQLDIIAEEVVVTSDPLTVQTLQTQIETEIQHQVPKKRGRKPKQGAEVAEGSTQIGRPPLASKALVNDTEVPKRITRSNSTKQVL